MITSAAYGSSIVHKILTPFISGRLESVNLLYLTLLRPGGILSRMLAFTPCGLQLYIEDCLRNYQFTTFKSRYEELKELSCPDMIDLYDIINNYVNSFEVKEADKVTQYIFQTVCLKNIYKDCLLKLTYDPRLMSTKINIKHLFPDKQTYLQTITFGVLMLTQRRPKLLDDFSHLYTKESDKILVREFLKNLHNLANEIDIRNETRKKPLYSAHPRFLEI